MTGPSRVDPRAVVNLPSDYLMKGSATWRAGTLYDVSASGAALLTDEPIPLQSLLSLRFSLPERLVEAVFVLVVEGLVVRADRRTDLDRGLPHLHGVYFLNLRGEPCDRLRRLVWERLAATDA